MFEKQIEVRAALGVHYDLHVVGLQGMVAIESQKELDDVIRARLGSFKEQVTTNTGLKAASLGIAHRIDKGPKNLTTYVVR